jgi:aminoglycoside phosphotransferase family enzyme
MVTDDSADRTQEQVFAFLSNAATHSCAEPVKRIDTHASVVFLADGDAFKVKRAVRFPFMDLSTLAKRQRVCEAELTVNRSFHATAV